MSNVAIRAKNLGKKYRIGSHQFGYKTLRDTLVGSFGKRASQRVESGDMGPESFWALKDVSFEVKPAEVVGIIGRNGAGKSTLLKILSRITEPTEGSVEIYGRVASLLEVGTGFHPELTGRENIYLNGAILGMKRAEIARKFEEIVAFAEVEKFLDTPVKHYSSGMYVRLAFAVAAHLEPEILLVDEVLAVGDADFQKKCLGKMESVAGQGRTVLFVSHNMAAIQALCKTGILLDSGRVAGYGAIDEQVNTYLRSDPSATDITSEEPIQLGGDLKLTSLKFFPNPTKTGAPIDFGLELRSSRPTRIEGLAILVYSSIGARVAILDLRQSANLYRLEDNAPLRIAGRINSLPLVEGQYKIGLYVSSEDFSGNTFDLFDLMVNNNTAREGLVSYPASARGVLDIDFAFSVVDSARGMN